MAGRRTRLLMLSPLPPPVGGIPTWTLGVLSSSLAERFEIEVVNTSPSHTTVHQQSRLRFDRVLDAARILGHLVWKLLRFRPEVVHINTPYSWAFLRDGAAVWIARLSGARTVLHFRGGDFPEFVESTPRLLHAWILATLRRTTRLIALTRHTETFLREQVGCDSTRYVPNFVRVEDIGSVPDRSLRPAGETLEVLMVGWILEGKGVRELLHAARGLSGVRFTLVGPAQPEFFAEIQEDLAALGDCVRVLPAMPRDQVMDLYRQADIFALPTHREGFPNVVLEAMAAGLPVVATPVGAIPDALRDGEEGLLVPARDADALQRALARLLEDRPLRLAMGARARERAHECFALEPVLEELEAVYRECVPESRS